MREEIRKETVTRTVYVASDGKEFNFQPSCEYHENWITFTNGNFTEIPELAGFDVGYCTNDEEDKTYRYYISPECKLYSISRFSDTEEQCNLRECRDYDFERIHIASKIAEILKANNINF